MQSAATTKRSVPVKAMVDPELKRQATELYGEIGMSLSTAINVFLRQSVLDGCMPFKPGYPSAPRIDFDDPDIIHARVQDGTVIVPQSWKDAVDDD